MRNNIKKYLNTTIVILGLNTLYTYAGMHTKPCPQISEKVHKNPIFRHYSTFYGKGLNYSLLICARKNNQKKCTLTKYESNIHDDITFLIKNSKECYQKLKQKYKQQSN